MTGMPITQSKPNASDEQIAEEQHDLAVILAVVDTLFETDPAINFDAGPQAERKSA